MFEWFFGKKNLKRLRAKKEIHESQFLPYKCFYDRDTIILKNDAMVRIIAVDGFSFETADDDDLELKKNNLNNIIRSISSDRYVIYVHLIRKKEGGFPGGLMEGKFATRVNEEWRQRHSGENGFKNQYYVSIVRASTSSGANRIRDFITKMQKGNDRKAKIAGLVDDHNDLDEVSRRILGGLSNYRARNLTAVNSKGCLHSEILEFLGFLVNLEGKQKYYLNTNNIDEYLPRNRLYFGPKAMRVSTPYSTKYAGVVCLKEYTSSTYCTMMDSFLQLPFEFIMCQTFTFINRGSAIAKIQLQQRRMIQAEDVAKSQIVEMNYALDAAMSGTFGFGKHSLTMVCIENSLKQLDSALSTAVVEFANFGATAVRESTNMEPAFWGIMPGNQDFIVRQSTINSLNFSSLIPFHNYPYGRKANNHWGDAVTILDTVSGTPFYFNFHVRDVGHTMIIGPTGAGKTVLMTFLCAQAQKFNCRMFFFDKDRGAEIFIRALGGKYAVISRSKTTGFNPFQLPDNDANRGFLIELLTVLVSEPGEKLDSTDIAKINEAVNGNYQLDFKDRRIANIAPFFGIGGPGSLAGKLEMWYGKGSHAKIFDNEYDLIDFSSSSNFGFEMGELLADKDAISPVLLYLFHRINTSLDGTPTMIILDEAWALIDNPVFGPKIKDWLKVLRKLNAFILFATQSVEDASKSAISDTLVQQTSTQIYLPNLKATPAYKTVFMLSEREYQLVKTIDPGSRFFLIKQDQSGVVARVNLYGMGDTVRVLSGRAETVALLDDIIEELGSDDPDDWLSTFIKRSANM